MTELKRLHLKRLVWKNWLLERLIECWSEFFDQPTLREIEHGF